MKKNMEIHKSKNTGNYYYIDKEGYAVYIDNIDNIDNIISETNKWLKNHKKVELNQLLHTEEMKEIEDYVAKLIKSSPNCFKNLDHNYRGSPLKIPPFPNSFEFPEISPNQLESDL